MENSQIETNSFRHFLLIRGVETEIIEPDNFDQSNFKVVQDDIARDTYFGNEESQLEFAINYGIPTGSYMNNDGVLISHLQSGVELLIEENKNYGNEADVKYILKKNGVSFTTGNVDFNKDFDTDNETYVKCRVIQNTNQALIKKSEDIIIDLLATKDLDDNTIEPISVQRMFLKAKPLYQVSKFKGNGTPAAGIAQFLSSYGFLNQTPANTLSFSGANNGNVVEEYDESTLGYISPEFAIDFNGTLNAENFTYIQANEELSNVNIKITDLVAFTSQNKQNFFSSNVLSGNGRVRLVVRVGIDVNTFTEYILYEKVFGFVDSTPIEYLPTNFSLNIPFIRKGERVYIYLQPHVENVSFDNVISPLAYYRVRAVMNDIKIEINGTATAISSVINAVRWIDLIKQNYKAIGSLPVNASKYDVGGEFYDNFLFTKNLIKQDLTKPFYLKLKDTKEHLLEQCAYAQINDNEIYIGQYEDFYTNNDLGGFLEVPDYEANLTKNPKYLVNNFVFVYEKYEQDRTEKNTSDAIHTNSEWYPQAINSINKKDFKLPFIRDPFITEVARKMIFSINKNSSSDDDNIFIADVTLLPPNSRNKFTRLLTWSANGTEGTTKILSDNSFSWTQLGFNIGDTIIESGVDRVVLDITPSMITLSFVGGIATGTNFLTFDYPLTNVLYTNRTSEGLIFANNLRNSENFGNLRYSIKRNIKHWFAVLATYGKFIPLKKIKNTYFKSNGECTTQFLGEEEPIKENEDILISDIADKKIISQDIYKTKVRCGFEQAVQLLNDIQNVRGFIRVQNPSGGIIKGYIKEGDNLWANEELALELEVKNESDFLNVTFSDGILYINEVGYTEKTATIKNYNIFNDFIQFFDINSINLCNRTKFDKVAVNGITYDNIDNLVNAIEAL